MHYPALVSEPQQNRWVCRAEVRVLGWVTEAIAQLCRLGQPSGAGK